MANYSKVSVTTESAASGNMNTACPAPDFTVNELTNSMAKHYQSELLYEIVYKSRLYTIRQFDFVWSNLTTTQAGQVRTFWITTTDYGMTPFNWTPPEETTALKLIFFGEWQRDLNAPGVWTVRLRAVELEN